MPHYRGDELLRAILLVVPVGVFVGRVKTGIIHMLSLYGNRNANIRLKLIVSEEYAKGESDYEGRIVKGLVEWLESSRVDTYPRMKVDKEYLPVTDRNRCTHWLVENLSHFFRENPTHSMALVDLTSAPKEWSFVTTDVSNLFDNVEFYNVSPTRRALLSDFTAEEIEDIGGYVQSVRTGSLTAPLRYWLHSTDEDGSLTEHRILFQTMWELTKTKGKPLRIDDIAESFRKRCLKEYDETLSGAKKGQSVRRRRDIRIKLERSKARLESMALENIKKKISRYLTDIAPYGLFKYVLGMIEFTETGAILASTTFPSSTSQARDA